MMRSTWAKSVFLGLASMTFAAAAVAQAPCSAGHWVTAWGAAVQTPLAFPGAPAALSVNNQTLRQIVLPTIGGECVRVRFTNEAGPTLLSLGSAHIALATADGSIVPGSDRSLTFGGKAGVDIPAGAPMLSDPVSLKIPAFTGVAISLYVAKQSSASSFHQLGQQATRLSGPGDFTGAPDLPGATETRSWYWLADLEIMTSQQTSGLVTFGDSITDGFGAKPGEYQDWPDLLAERLAQTAGSPKFAVANEGIGGNRILHDGAGVSALARFDRDVLAKPGVTEMILLEGINDIGWPNMKPPNGKSETMQKGPFADQVVTAGDLIQGMKQLIERAHCHGIKVFGATMTPYEGAGYFTPAGETVRETVNEWIRSGGAFDGVIDFDAAVRDPDHPQEFREAYQAGDHLHPNEAGYKAMAATINIDQLRVSSDKSVRSSSLMK